MPNAQRPDPSGPLREVVELRLADVGYAGREVLAAVDAVAGPGAHVLLVGDNGSGKTTLLATLAGLLPKRGGHLRVLGSDPLDERRALHQHIGHLGHRDPFYAELTGRENLLFHARLRGLGMTEVDQGLERVGLEQAAGRPVGEYSHGMRRRLGLAKALLGDPRLLLLDEPESGLDARGRNGFRALLDRHPGRTVLLSTHHWLDWLEWADRAWVLESGRLDEVRLEGDAAARRAAVAARQVASRGEFS